MSLLAKIDYEKSEYKVTMTPDYIDPILRS